MQTPYFTPLKLYHATFVTKFYLKHYFGDIQHQFLGTFFTPSSPLCKAYSSRFTNLRKVTPRQEINIARFKNHKILRKKIEWFRSSRSQMFFKIGIFKNFVNLTEKHSKICQKNRGLNTFNFFKKRIQHRCFLLKFAKFLRTTFLQNFFARCFWRLALENYVILPIQLQLRDN